VAAIRQILLTLSAGDAGDRAGCVDLLLVCSPAVLLFRCRLSFLLFLLSPFISFIARSALLPGFMPL
jgi:hypothetical protein